MPQYNALIYLAFYGGTDASIGQFVLSIRHFALVIKFIPGMFRLDLTGNKFSSIVSEGKGNYVVYGETNGVTF